MFEHLSICNLGNSLCKVGFAENREAKCFHLISSKHSKARILAGYECRNGSCASRFLWRIGGSLNIVTWLSILFHHHLLVLRENLDELRVAWFWGTSCVSNYRWTCLRWCMLMLWFWIIILALPTQLRNLMPVGLVFLCFPIAKHYKARVVVKFCCEMLKVGDSRNRSCPKFPLNQWHPPSSAS